jgi:hypothetical protein
MPEKETVRRARRDKAEGKSPSTQAGEFVHEEIEHIREGKHGARSTKQAIAKARRAGVKLPPPKKGTTSARTRRQAARDAAKGARRTKPSARRARASLKRLKREGHSAASSRALGRQARQAARRRSAADRSAAARKAARTRARRSAPRATARRG